MQTRRQIGAGCGLGVKTILLAEQGYEVEGADASSDASVYAPRLSEEKGLAIRFLHARNAELGTACGHTYDCVYGDGFDELDTRENLDASARGIYSVLDEGGLLVLSGPQPKWSKSDLKSLIDREWEERTPFEVSPPCERGGVRLTQLEVDEKTAEGILEKRIHPIEEKGVLRAEMAFMMNRRAWTFRDFDEVLSGAGFRSVSTDKTGRTLFIVAVR